MRQVASIDINQCSLFAPSEMFIAVHLFSIVQSVSCQSNMACTSRSTYHASATQTPRQLMLPGILPQGGGTFDLNSMGRGTSRNPGLAAPDRPADHGSYPQANTPTPTIQHNERAQARAAAPPCASSSPFPPVHLPMFGLRPHCAATGAQPRKRSHDFKSDHPELEGGATYGVAARHCCNTASHNRSGSRSPGFASSMILRVTTSLAMSPRSKSRSDISANS